mmetsp:Transcript_11549/g.29839  ORF Transcript_11549/g.29839 Transcript_11549/m.29839 type:complete len:214 (+) Transcript_11549:32-673(+)
MKHLACLLFFLTSLVRVTLIWRARTRRAQKKGVSLHVIARGVAGGTWSTLVGAVSGVVAAALPAMSEPGASSDADDDAKDARDEAGEEAPGEDEDALGDDDAAAAAATARSAPSSSAIRLALASQDEAAYPNRRPPRSHRIAPKSSLEALSTAAAHTWFKSAGACCSSSHARTSTCPSIAAKLAAQWFHGHPFALAHRSTFRWPPFAAPSQVH